MKRPFPWYFGIIPAYAGSTRTARIGVCRSGDHPRVCGEHMVDTFAGYFGKGSSPRMRGALNHPSFQRGALGIIPAYAGSTMPIRTSKIPPRDHPRVCGEHCVGHPGVERLEGSSPRMRGARMGAWMAACLRRIIPAYAGSTSLKRPRLAWCWDHPRVCGEHPVLGWLVRGGRGSSPRMRGAPYPVNMAGSLEGIIPAYAGSTTLPEMHLSGMRDHPRVCGEHIQTTSHQSVV